MGVTVLPGAHRSAPAATGAPRTLRLVIADNAAKAPLYSPKGDLGVTVGETWDVEYQADQPAGWTCRPGFRASPSG